MAHSSSDSPRMFESNLVDWFSRISWWVVPLVWVPIACLSVLLSVRWGVSWAAIAGQVVAGFAFWTFAEYWLHRTVFHWVPATAWGPKFHFLVHGVHHKWFNDRMRLVMPPAAALFLGVLFWCAFWVVALLLSGWVSSTWVPAVYAGMVVGYIHYDLAHYYVHHGRPKLAYYKHLRAHHNAHHHNPKYKELKFGVSNTFWDHVFGTYG